MKASPIAIGLAIATTALAMMLWLLPAEPAADPGEGPPVAEVASPAAVVAPVPGAGELARSGSGAESAAAGEPPESRRGWVDLEGTFAVRDGAGALHRELDGQFELLVEAGADREELVEVRGGRWRTQLPPDAWLQIGDIQLGGRLAHLDALEALGSRPIPDGLELALEASWPQPLSLRVVSAQTGEDLEGVTVLNSLGNYRSGHDHPGDFLEQELAGSPFTPDSYRIEDEASPVSLPESRLLASRHWVHANGHAWATLRVDHAAGGEHWIALESESRLSLTFVDAPAATPFVVRLLPEGAPQQYAKFELFASTASLEIDGIAPGPYEVRVEVDAALDTPVFRLGGARIHLAPGATEARVLTLEALPVQPAPVSARVRVQLAPGWSPESLSLAFEPLGPQALGRPPLDALGAELLTRLPGEPPLLEGLLEEMPPGPYRLVASSEPGAGRGAGGRVSREIEVLSDETIELALPELCQVSIRLLDDASGAPLPVGGRYEIEHRGELLSAGHDLSERDRRTGAFRFAFPVGPAVLRAEKAGYLPLEEPLIFASGANERVLALNRAPALEVALRDGDRTVLFDWEETGRSGLRLEELEGAGLGLLIRPLGRSLVISASNPGRYRVFLQAPPGYRPVEPEAVELGSGRSTELVVLLERLP